MIELEPARPEQWTEPEILALARRVADEVCDPCGMAIGLNVGLAEMGLIRELAASPAPDGWNIRLRLRLTSPGCQYFFFFREELERRLLAQPVIVAAEIEWDQTLDWTPADMAETARQRIAERQQRARQAGRAGAGRPVPMHKGVA
jgi:metal-sulfur cluster biosynthetic enzyme